MSRVKQDNGNDWIVVMDTKEKSVKPFGSYAPLGRNKVVLFLVRLGFGRGKLKRLLSRLWKDDAHYSVVDVIFHDVKMRLNRFSNNIESKLLFSSKLKDAKELEAIRQSVRSGGNFIDIGANVGYYSLMAAKFGSGKVMSIEPNPELIKKFNENIKFNGFEDVITIIPIVLGETETMAKLHLTPGNLGTSSLIKSDQSIDFIEVKERPLKDVLAENEIQHIDALKIDVEGYEDRVLMTFFKSVDQSLYPKLIVIEESSNGEWQEDVLKWMISNGYDVVKRTRGNVILSRVVK